MKSKIWNSLKNYEWPILWLAAVTALILGILGFKQYFGNTRTEWDVLYLALQLFTMESGFQSGTIGPVLNIARFLAPLVTVYTATKALTVIFRNQLQLVRLKTQQGHVVIAGLGRSGVLFAEAFRKAGESVVVIEKNEDNDQLENCRDVGALTLVGDARTPEVLAKARVDQARVLICVAGEDGVNAEIAVQTRGMLIEQNGRLTSVVHIVDSQLRQLLRKQELMTLKNNRMRVEFFNVYESAIRDLLVRYPAFQQSGSPNLLIIGLGQMGETLLLATARNWIQKRSSPSERLAVTVVDRSAKKKVEALSARYPYLAGNCSIITSEMEVASPQFYERTFLKNPDTSDVYVCLDNDSLVLSTALLLRQWLPATTPIYVRMSQTGGLSTLLEHPAGMQEKSKLIPFGSVERFCTPELLSRGMKEILARVIHEEYVKDLKQEGASPEHNPSLSSWEELPEWLKESNRTQADHIGEKLKSVQCDLISFSNEEAETFQFSDPEIESLAKMEHERWVEERKKDGWKYAPGEKDIKNKTSPYLLPYEEISEQVKEYNRNTVRELPRFLARAGYQIYRI